MGQFTEAPLYNACVKAPTTSHCVKRFSVIQSSTLKGRKKGKDHHERFFFQSYSSNIHWGKKWGGHAVVLFCHITK